MTNVIKFDIVFIMEKITAKENMIGDIMQGIGNRIIIWIGCLVLEIMVIGISTKVVIAALLALTVSSFGIYFIGTKDRLSIILIYGILVFNFQECIYFIAVIMYEWLNTSWKLFIEKDKNREILISNQNTFNTDAQSKDVFFSLIVFLFVVIGLINHFSEINEYALTGILFLVVISIWMNIYYHKNSDLKQLLIVTRDNSAELTIALKNKNKYLIEKQDYEIYSATLRERNRIAREIHDNVGHMLTRSILQIGAIITMNKDSELRPFLDGIKDTLDLAMTSIRTSVHDLHDEAIDLKEAIHEIATKGANRFELKVDFDMSKDIPRNIKYCFISIVKESISNINKHSNADLVNISLREHPAFYRLEVEDNGTVPAGFNFDEYESNGIGLSNIKDRIDSFNGTCNIYTKNGFKIVISIPKIREEI